MRYCRSSPQLLAPSIWLRWSHYLHDSPTQCFHGKSFLMDSVISEELYSSVNLEQFVIAICQCHGAAWWIFRVWNLYLFIFSHEIKGLKFHSEVKNFLLKIFLLAFKLFTVGKLCHLILSLSNQRRAINIHIWCMTSSPSERPTPYRPHL